jgi:hypothetical protein
VAVSPGGQFNPQPDAFGRTGRRQSKQNPFWTCGGIEMCSLWNAPSDPDYYDPVGAYCDEDETEICGDSSARWDRGEACEDWCETKSASAGTGSGQ